MKLQEDLAFSHTLEPAPASTIETMTTPSTCSMTTPTTCSSMEEADIVTTEQQQSSTETGALLQQPSLKTDQPSDPSNAKESTEGNFDDILSGIGMGRWQILFILVICLTKASFPPTFISSTFTNMPRDFKCAKKLIENSSHVMAMFKDEFDNKCSGTYNISLKEQQFVANGVKYTLDSSEGCEVFDFDTSSFSSTFASEFNLVCDSAWLSPLYQMTAILGLAIGSAFIGLSDKNGRVTMFRIGAAGCLIGTLMIGIAPQIFLVLLGRFIIGFCSPIINVSGYALAMETIPPAQRSMVGLMVWLPSSLSQMIMGAVSLYIQDWRMLHLVISIYIYLIAIFSLFLDKSPRWLVQRGRYDEAIQVLGKAARLNNGSLPPKNELMILLKQTNQKYSFAFTEAIKSNKNLLETVKGAIKLFIGSSAMRVLWVIPPLIWFFLAVVYFGVPLNANNFTTNPYIYIFMTGMATMPPTVIGELLVKRFGIVFTLVVTFTSTGLCFLSLLFASDNIWWLRWVLVLTAMMTICLANITCDYLVFALFPTILRTVGFGVNFIAFYAGFFISSYLVESVVGKSWWIFNVICSICCLICVGLSLMLPEVQFEPLCDTVDDVKQRDIKLKGKNFWDIIKDNRKMDGQTPKTQELKKYEDNDALLEITVKS